MAIKAPNVLEPLIPNQEVIFYTKQLDFYQNNSAIGKLKRAKRYIKECDISDPLPKETIDRIFTGVIVGGSVGAGGGALIGACCFGVGAVPGAIAGGVSGAIIGGSIGYLTIEKTVRENYIEWKRLHRKDEFIAEFNKFHEDHAELQDFICHITNSIYVDPVITKWGHTYSREGLMQWLRTHDTDPLPHDNEEYKKMTIDDIQVDYYMIGKMKRAYIKILNDAQQLQGLSNETIAGLRAISRDLNIEFKAAFNRAKNEADQLFQKDIINPKQFAKIISDTAEKLGD